MCRHLSRRLCQSMCRAPPDSTAIKSQRDFAFAVKNRRRRTTESDVACPKMLFAMDQNRPLFSDARADPICTLDLLGEDTSEPNPPSLELLVPGFVAAVVNRNAFAVAQQNDIAFLANDRKQTIDLFLSRND